MEAIREIEAAHRKPALPQVKTGDTVKVHQLIKEGNKQRIQVFEGVIIRRHRMDELTACITVRRIASGVGVEKTFLMHSPNVSKIEILRRAKVRRNFLSYLRDRRGKSARLQELAFDKVTANDVSVFETPAQLDADVTEISTDENQDALDDAVSINSEVNAENAEAAAEDNVTPADDEQAIAAEEVQEGLDKADPGEGKAIKS
ncbi:50S ribosomal protein L19 [Candidatus Saccharibacteria bacterium]|nr:50S ribosomal protein L19 [Candidatus Saccharibacteria bacterium]